MGVVVVLESANTSGKQTVEQWIGFEIGLLGLVADKQEHTFAITKPNRHISKPSSEWVSEFAFTCVVHAWKSVIDVRGGTETHN